MRTENTGAVEAVSEAGVGEGDVSTTVGADPGARVVLMIVAE